MENQLNITYSPDKSLGADSFWAYMIQKGNAKEDPSTVTYAEAAQVIDNMYDIKPCGTETEQEAADGSTAQESSSGGSIDDADFPTFEEYQAQLAAAFLPVYNPCEGLFLDNSYNATLLIYRSDVTKPYKLNLGNAEVVSTVIQTADVSIVLPINGDTVQVELPIQEGLEADFEIADWNSKTVLFRNDIVGTVTLKYKTSYEEVEINVKAIDDEPGTCQCLLFYERTVSEVNISPPDIDEEAQNLLNCDIPQDTSSSTNEDRTSTEIVVPPSDCYQRYLYTTMCNCAPYDALSSYSEVVQVPCNIPFSSPTPEGVYNSWQDAVYINGYVYCDDLEPWEGHDEEYYIEKCCVPPPDDISLPICRESKAVDYGGQDIIKGKEFYVGNILSGEVLNFVPIGPKNGICGEITYVQDVASKNCCDDPTYVDMVFDEDNSVDVLADFSSGYIFWGEGKSPYTVSVRGNGFYLDDLFTVKDADTRFAYAVIYTEDACGPCTVTISDGCSEVSTTIRSTNGYWDYVSADCEMPGVGGEVLGLTTLYVENVVGKYRQTQAIVGQTGVALKRQIDTDCNDRVYDDCADAGYECSELTIEGVYGHDLCDSSINGYQFSWNGNGCVSFKANDHYLGAPWDWYDENDCGAVVFNYCNLGDYSVDYDCSCWYQGFVKSYLTTAFWEWKC